MDLFGDLPPPAATSPSKPDALFGDLPRASSSCTTPPGALRPSSADGDEEPLAKRKPSAGCPALRGFVAHRREPACPTTACLTVMLVPRRRCTAPSTFTRT
eukprot:scpid68713/ scgid2040/ 